MQHIQQYQDAHWLTLRLSQIVQKLETKVKRKREESCGCSREKNGEPLTGNLHNILIQNLEKSATKQSKNRLAFVLFLFFYKMQVL